METKAYNLIEPKDLAKNTTINLQVCEAEVDMYWRVAIDVLEVIEANNKKNEPTVMVVPYGPLGPYARLVDLVNKYRISLKNCVFINMDEYMENENEYIDESDPLSFRGGMNRIFYSKIDEELNVLPENRLFPDPKNPGKVQEIIDKYGKLDMVFGGVGINGHYAFNEPPEPGEECTNEEFLNRPTRVLKISRETKTINAFMNCGANLDAIPDYCITVGMKEMYQAKKVIMCMPRDWNEGALRKVLHGEITCHVPCSLFRNHPDATLYAAAVATAVPSPKSEFTTSNMNDLLIKNAKVVLSDTVTDKVSVLVLDGKIAEIDCKSVPEGIETLDANGQYLFAGFIESHIHGGGGADFMDGTAEAFETVTRTHLKHGTTALVPTSMTATPEELQNFVKAYLDFLKTDRKGAKTLGLHLEGPYLSGAGGKSKGAQRGDLLRYPDFEEIKNLMELSEGHIIRWDAAPELPDALKFAEYLSEKGVICSMAHSTATTDEAEAGIKAGFSHVTHCYNAITTYHKDGQKVLDGVVEAAYLNDDVVIELICDGCHIPKGVARLALKIKGPEKVCAITDAMRIAGTDMQKGYLGTPSCGSEVIVDDGVAKLKDLSSFAGSIATSDRCLKVLCKDYGIDVCDASKMLSLAPAKLHKIDKDYGSIEVGKIADLVITDCNYTVKNVILDGIIQKL